MKRRSSMISVRVDDAFAERVREMAKELRVNVSDVVLAALSSQLDNYNFKLTPREVASLLPVAEEIGGPMSLALIAGVVQAMRSKRDSK